MSTGIALAEKGYIPDSFIKFGIRRLLSQRIKEMPEDTADGLQDYVLKMVNALRNSPIALETKAANEQHYEVPAAFYRIALGKHLKYSSAYYDLGAKTLDEAESDMLSLTAARAQIEDGMSVMDLGCGWGSFSLWAAQQFKNCQIHSVSNSNSQREYILGEAKRRGLSNITVTTADINHFNTIEKFDRIVSVEMFEHMRNYGQLLGKISNWLKPDGKLFVHIFCHKNSPYYFETEGDDNWMGKYFFTGGIMPSNHLLLYFQDQLAIDQHWVVNGSNYEKTALAWLKNIDDHKKEVMAILTESYKPEEAEKWFHRWRIFFLSCAELFGYRNGHEWWVSHYLFKKKG